MLYTEISDNEGYPVFRDGLEMDIGHLHPRNREQQNRLEIESTQKCGKTWLCKLVPIGIYIDIYKVLYRHI
jgi:hypothetical protein